MTIVGTTGLAAAPASATADDDGIDTIAIENVGTWVDRWRADGDLPVVDELFVFVHGWLGDATATDHAADVLESLRAGGYDPDAAVALEWPIVALDAPTADQYADDAGAVTADLLAAFYDAGGGDVRLIGHALGARCALWAATELGWEYEIETVATLGAAVDGSELCDGPFDDALENACAVRNYYSENDEIVGPAYGGPDDTALGADGADCEPAGAYTDVDVTDSVSSHLEFLGDAAVGADLADAVDSGTCDDSSDGDDGWGWF